MLRMLREPGTGRPGPGVRLLAMVLVACMIGIAGRELLPALDWVVGLL